MDTRFFDTLSETLTKTAKELGEKTEIFYGKQKLRGQVLAEQRAADKALAAIGKAIYERYAAGEEMEEALADLCVEVKNHMDKIDALKEDIADKAGKKVCPSCGKSMDRSAVFCPACGAAFPEEEAAEEVVEEDILEEAAEEVKDAVEEIVEEVVEEITEE